MAIIKRLEKGKSIAKEEPPKQKELILQPPKALSSTTLDVMSNQELKEQIMLLGKTLGTMEDKATTFQLMVEEYETNRKEFEKQQAKDVTIIKNLKAKLQKIPNTRSEAKNKPPPTTFACNNN